MTSTQTQTRPGFTLIEILIAMAIIGIAGAIIAPNLIRFLARGKDTATKATLSSLQTIIESFKEDTGQYPETLRDLTKKPSNQEVAEKWHGPYTKQNVQPVDGWGNRIQYKLTAGSEHPYELYSYGPHGKGAPKSEWIDAWSL